MSHPTVAIAQIPIERPQPYEQKARMHSYAQLSLIAISNAELDEVTATQRVEVEP